MNRLSIIVPTYNRLPRLKQVLAGLERQQVSFEGIEVVVVSDGSTDGTDRFLQTITSPLNLNYVFQENAGVAAARNSGIQAATGELALFLDDDVVPAPSLVQTHLEVHAQHGPNTVVLGPMITPPGFQMRPWIDWEQRMLYKQYGDMVEGKYAPTARQFFTGNTSLRRRHLLEQGGFDTRFRRAEDVELAYRLARAGLIFVFSSEAIGYHYADRSFGSWLSTPYTYGQNDVVFWRELGCDWLLPTVWQEYHGRNALIRFATATFLDRPWLSDAFIQLMKQAANVSKIAARFAFSAIFNLRYYQGIADELGGREAFFAGAACYSSRQQTSATDRYLDHRANELS